ncbi:DUF4411 family protein [Pseudoalteromonas rhizosphaerae]|uniref:DUF4411 family protein n=1 Tax=Pseudoalteromonas rhizosphaerae TaxID=2518973 RepID=UPI00384B1651
MNYLFDANTFIEAKNRYYRMNVCPAYWDWLIHSHAEGKIFSIDMIKAELLQGNDDLTAWIKVQPQMFVSESDDATQEAFVKVAEYVMTLNHMNKGTHEEFLSVADPWLVAKAIVTGATIVTHEHFDQYIKKKILIPNIAKYFGVECINTFEVLDRLDAEFILSP